MDETAGGRNAGVPRRSPSPKAVYALLLAVLLAVAATRLWELPKLPPGLWYDEAYYAMDAAWLAETHQAQAFFPGNNGREPIMPYLGAISMSLLGETPYALRLVSALAAIVTVALVYRWLMTLFADDPDRRWLAFVASGGCAFGFWYLVMSRTGHRAALFPAFFVLTAWLFWRAWRSPGPFTGRCSLRDAFRACWFHWVVAGLALGISQYSYLSARLLPVAFVLFALMSTILRPARSLHVDPSTAPKACGEVRPVGTQWLGLALMGVISAIVFVPLGLYFLQHPGTFASRSEDVFVLDQIARGATTWPQQLLDALRVFLDGSDPNWRHNLVGQPGFNLIESAGFWIGLLVSLRRVIGPPLANSTRDWRVNDQRPAYLFLLSSLLVMWLPALLSVPAVYTLRLSGLLPVYYAIMAVGWLAVARWVTGLLAGHVPVSHLTGMDAEPRLRNPRAVRSPGLPGRHGDFVFTGRGWVGPAVLLLVLGTTGVLTTYSYFVRWARTPMVYSQYNGPLADLAHYMAQISIDADVLVPLPVYLHPTVHFLLRTEFPESDLPPVGPEDGNRPARLVQVPDIFLIPNVVSVNRQSSYVWLSRDRAGRGSARILHLRQPGDISVLESAGESVDFVSQRTLETVATITPYRSLAPLVHVAQAPRAAIVPRAVGGVRGAISDPKQQDTHYYDWGHQVQLTGYDISPALVSPGGETTLNLYWRGTTDQPMEYRTFVHLLAADGRPVGQVNGIALSEEQRWRAGRLAPEQHTLHMPADAAAGTYLVRVGVIDQDTRARLPVYSAGGRSLGDQLQLGVVYVSDDGRDPRVPDTALAARFGEAIEVLGFSMPPCDDNRSGICVRLNWQSVGAAEYDYTAFVQLLDGANQRVAGYDAQPLGGLYPTSRWQPGEIVVDEFALALPDTLPEGRYRLVTGMYDLASGHRLPVVTANGTGQPDAMLVLRELQLPTLGH